MKLHILRRLRTSCLLTLPWLIAGCGTPQPKDFGGPWHPVNRYQSAPMKIALSQSYTFFAAPMDGTLKSMLARWAKDSGRTLDYQLHADYTLFSPVTRIHTTDIQEAARQLSEIYATEAVRVAIQGRDIVVTQPSAITSDAAASKEAQTPVKSQPVGGRQ